MNTTESLAVPAGGAPAEQAAEHLVLGRVFVDAGYRELFRESPAEVARRLDVTLTDAAIERINDCLSRLSGEPASDGAVRQPRISDLDRWKQF